MSHILIEALQSTVGETKESKKKKKKNNCKQSLVLCLKNHKTNTTPNGQSSGEIRYNGKVCDT